VTTFYRRRLPHLQAIGQPLFLTWRLYGSLPPNRIFPAGPTPGKAFLALDSLLDRATSGPLYLGMPEIAKLTVDAFRHGAERMRLYQLHAYVVMPNHVHLLITPMVQVAKITHSLERFTAKEANRVLGMSGQPFWQDESYDRLVRDQREFERIVCYVEHNPVRAGLSTVPEGFCWSSAEGRLKIGQQDGILPH
jgi:putative DNA methylase